MSKKEKKIIDSQSGFLFFFLSLVLWNSRGEGTATAKINNII